MNKQRISREKQRWDDESGGYDEAQEPFDYVLDETVSRAVAGLKPDSSVIEFGCGTGLITLRLAPHVKSVTGFDISNKMLELGKQSACAKAIENVQFLNGDIYDLPCADASCDMVLCGYVLDIVERPTAVLTEAMRLLKPDGVLVSVTDCYQDMRPISAARKIARDILRVARSARPSHNRSITRRPSDIDLTRMTNDAGFRVIESAIIDLGLPNHFNLFLKAVKFP